MTNGSTQMHCKYPWFQERSYTPMVSGEMESKEAEQKSSGEKISTGSSYVKAGQPWASQRSQEIPTRDRPSEGLLSESTHSYHGLKARGVRRLAAASAMRCTSTSRDPPLIEADKAPYYLRAKSRPGPGEGRRAARGPRAYRGFRQ